MTTDQEVAPGSPNNQGPVSAATVAKAPLWRRVLATVLGVIAILALLVSLLMTWQKVVIQDEDQFVAALVDLPSDDAVATVLSERIADRIVDRADVNDFVVGALPESLEFLGTPLTLTVTNVISNATHTVLVSEGFSTVWEASLRAVHRSVSVVLSGNDGAIVSEDGTVAIDLNAIAGLAASRLEARGVTLPNLDVEFGEIVLYESDQLATAQTVAELMHTLGWFIPLAAILLVAITMWAAPDRRRMTAFLGFGTALAVLVSLALLRTGRGSVVGSVTDETTRQARSVVWDALTDLLVQMAWAAFALSLIIGIAAWVFGPSKHARHLKAGVTNLIARWGEPGDSEPSSISRFFDEWLRAIEVAVVVIAVFFLLWGPPPTVLMVVATALVTLGLVIAAEVVAGPTHSSDDERVEVDA